MKQQEIDKLVRNGDLIITTKEILINAVVQSVEGLYRDNGYCIQNHNDKKEFEQLSKKECTELANDVIDYLTGIWGQRCGRYNNKERLKYKIGKYKNRKNLK